MIKPKDAELLSTGVILRSPRQEGAGAALWSWPGGAEQLGGVSRRVYGVGGEKLPQNGKKFLQVVWKDEPGAREDAKSQELIYSVKWCPGPAILVKIKICSCG